MAGAVSDTQSNWRDGVRLPDGMRLRAPSIADLQAVNDLVRACELAEDGAAQSTADDLLGEWQASRFDLQRDAWLVETADGSLAGYGRVWDRAGSGRLQVERCVHPRFTGQGIGRVLVRISERRAGEMAPQGRQAAVDNIVSHGNEDARRLLEEEGYRPERYFWRMMIEMDREPTKPSLPDGIAIRTFKPHDGRAVYELVQEAFADNHGYERVSYEDWANFITGRESFDPSLFFLAVDGELIAGVALCPRYEGMGWVRQLAVAREYRGRGIARALLRHSFREFYRRGEREVGLVVDSYNRTGARQLYESVGMRVARQHDSYRKVLEPDDGDEQ